MLSLLSHCHIPPAVSLCILHCCINAELDARRVSENIESAHIIAMCEGCPKLHRLALGGTRDTGSGIGMVGATLTDEAVMSIGSLKHLEVLNLHSFRRDSALDVPLLLLLQSCTTLRQLSLSNLELTDQLLTHTEVLRHLRMLRLAACVGVTFRGIYLFQQKCKSTEVRFKEYRH